MPDIPGDASTGQTISIGSTVQGTLEAAGDHDWYRIDLVAGQAVTVWLTAALPLDTALLIRNSNGDVIRDEVPMPGTTNSRITFTAAETGSYYLDVGAIMNMASGNYQLSVSAYTAPPVASIADVAEFLIEGSELGQRAFDVDQGGSITVNISNLNATGQYLARQALDMWSDLIGVQFVEVTSNAQILFVEDEPGAWAQIELFDGVITGGYVNIAQDLVAFDGPNIGGIAFQLYLHEIGHVLGLGHAGPYNGANNNYITDALFANDGWPTTVMSYFDQEASVYFADLGYSFAFYGSPMIADIAAMNVLYGLSTITRTGDTTYGFNSTAGRDIFDATLHPNNAYTLFDSSGVDTLDYSGFSADQVIHLTEGVYSNVGGLVGNVVIALGTVIENLIGGSGDDELVGNAADNRLTGGDGTDILTGGGGVDVLIGGAGGDAFRDTAAGLNGDTILDFTTDDAILITDANIATFAYALSGSTLTYSGGSLTLSGDLSGTLVATASAVSGVVLQLEANPPPPPVPRPRLLLTAGGQDFTIGGDVAVIGTAAAGEVIEILHGDVQFDASFNLGGDTVVLPGNAGSYSVVMSGSFAIITGGDLTVAIPVGIVGLDVQFADSTRSLFFDAANVQPMLGTQPITSVEQPVATSGAPLSNPPESGPDTLASLILTAPGQDLEIDGNVLILGTSGPDEIITVLGGTMQFDASFNVGGDTVVMPGSAHDYGATLAGSYVTLTDGETSVAIPVGVAGLTVSFDDADLVLRFDVASGTVRLGDQPVPSSGAGEWDYLLDSSKDEALSAEFLAEAKGSGIEPVDHFGFG